MRIFAATIVCVLLSACAAQPEYRSDVDRSVDFTSYETYSYVSKPGTDHAGYSTLTTMRFKAAIDVQMAARGYRLTDSDPELLINFFANVEDRETTRTTTVPTAGLAYYDYRLNLFGTFPLYETETRSVEYKQGTLNVDIIDAAEGRLIWEGIAEGRLTNAVMNDPESAIRNAIAGVFELFPVQPSP